MTELAADRHAAFEQLVAPLRGQLRAHCYRMLGSVHEADDAVQEALVRAWRGLGGFAGRGSLRSWVYAITTRCCLDALDARRRRVLPIDLGPAQEAAVLDDPPLTDVAWLEPFPDGDPELGYEQRESVELAFVAALQHLPANQRAALVLFEVLDFSAAEIADMVGTSPAAVNSALQRARATLSARAPDVSQQRAMRIAGDGRVRELVAGYASALERGDADALVELLTADVTWAMPPLAGWYAGLDSVRDFAVAVPIGSCGAWRHLPTSANGQPSVACYLSRDGAAPFAAWAINVFTVREDRIAAITSFLGPEHFPAFGLPDQLD